MNSSTEVWVQTFFIKRGMKGILNKLYQPHSYIVQIKNKGIKRRNQMYIRKRRNKKSLKERKVAKKVLYLYSKSQRKR